MGNSIGDIAKLFPSRGGGGGMPTLTAPERKRLNILIVDSDQQIRSTLRQTLSILHYEGITDTMDHGAALQRIAEREISHVIFEAKKTNMPSGEFVHKALEYDPRLILIASSYEPTVDDVFDLLIKGARGYIVKPFTSGALDDAIVMATKGEPISDAILYARDRNEALASLIMTAYDRLATTSRQARQFETAKREIPKLEAAFRRTVDIGRTFAQGNIDSLADAITEFCLERSNGPATKLGRLRQRLKNREDELGTGKLVDKDSIKKDAIALLKGTP